MRAPQDIKNMSGPETRKPLSQVKTSFSHIPVWSDRVVLLLRRKLEKVPKTSLPPFSKAGSLQVLSWPEKVIWPLTLSEQSKSTNGGPHAIRQILRIIQKLTVK